MEDSVEEIYMESFLQNWKYIYIYINDKVYIKLNYDTYIWNIFYEYN